MASQNISDSSRKRLRSTSSASTTSGASSPKRAASDSPATPANAKSPLHSLPPLAAEDAEVDEAMHVRGEGSSGIKLHPEDPLPGPSTSASLTSKQKLERIQELQKHPLKLGESWYIISHSWYRNWASACGGAPVKGAPDNENQVTAVDNSPIAGPGVNKFNGEVLHEGINIELVPKEGWDLLVSWYGTPTHAFERKVIAEGVNNSLRIEFYPISCPLYLCRLVNPQPPIRICELSKGTTLAELRDEYLDPILLEIQHQYFRLWKDDSVPNKPDEVYTPQRVIDAMATIVFGNEKDYELDKITVEDAHIADGHRLVLEVQEGGQWRVWGLTVRPSWSSQHQNSPASSSRAVVPLFGPTPDFFSSMEATKPIPVIPGSSRSAGKEASGSSSAYFPQTKPKPLQPEKVRGTLGLNNLGNTCYMNSALQCLAHLPELTEYFLSGAFQQELNPDNPLSTGGELARSYGSLLQSLFANSNWSFAPRDFKMKIARHSPTFSGYMQHDTQELLAFLLDGLHEDLNRILKKPYVENPEWEGGGALELCRLARDFWTGYKKRNDSVIVDLFQGQYKSTLICPECSKVSVTFDPFMYLTLPLPIQKMWEHDVYFVTWDNDRPNYKTHVMIPSTSTFRDLKVLLGKWFTANPDNMYAADIFQARIYKLFPDYQGVTDLQDHDVLFVYELPVPSGQSPSAKPSPTDSFVVPVYTISHITPNNQRFANNRWSKEAWGFPFFIAVDPREAVTEEDVYAGLVERYEQATFLFKDLYRWEEEDAVMVSAPPTQPLESSGELVARPVEDLVTTEKLADSDDDSMEEVKLPPYNETTGSSNDGTPSTSNSLVRVGPKPELFAVTIMEENFDISQRVHSGASYDLGKAANIPARFVEGEEAMQQPGSEGETEGQTRVLNHLLRRGDGIVCEWDQNIRQLYFGDKGMGPQSRWQVTEDYVDEEQQSTKDAQFDRLRNGITIDDCLDEFVKEEKLGEADPWYCPRCKKHQQATKKFDLWKVPDILVVHLKRFSNSRVLRDKIDVHVDFPVEGLNLESRIGERAAARTLKELGADVDDLGIQDVDEPLTYDLFAVDEHMGGLGGGHYRAYAKNADDERWYHFDDTRVEACNAKAAVTNLAYLLFYRRRTMQTIGGATMSKIEEAQTAGGEVLPEPKSEPEHDIFSGPSFAPARSYTPSFGVGFRSISMEPMEPFPPSASQINSPHTSTATLPTTPELESQDFRPSRSTRQYGGSRRWADRSPSSQDIPSDHGDPAWDDDPPSDMMLNELETTDVVPMLAEHQGDRYSPNLDFPLRSVDEDYDGTYPDDDAVDEILIEGPLDAPFDFDKTAAKPDLPESPKT